MSTELTPTSFESNNHIYKAYTPKKGFTNMILSSYLVIGDEVLAKLYQRALTNLGKASINNLFSIDPNSYIDTVYKNFLNPKSQQVQQICMINNISEKEFIECVGSAKAVAMSFFKNPSTYTFSYSFNENDLDKWKKDTFINMSNHSYQSLGMLQSSEPVSFTDQDLTAFGLNKEDVSSEPKQMSCVAFALLQAKEKAATQLIFQKNSHMAFSEIIKNLTEWKYRSVDTPDEGDLVVYLNIDAITHIGYFSSSGLVHSKLGSANPYSHHHKLFDVPPTYGKRILFFRKSSALF